MKTAEKTLLVALIAVIVLLTAILVTEKKKNVCIDCKVMHSKDSIIEKLNYQIDSLNIELSRMYLQETKNKNKWKY